MTTTKSNKTTAGLLGAGSIAEAHLRALKRLPYVRVIGIADLNEDRASALAKSFRVPAAYSSLEKMLEERPDVIHVLTPPEAHAESALKALAAGCHVYVEKPLATSAEDCDRIAAAAKEAGKSVCVGHSLLRDPFVRRALEIVRRGKIGEVVAVDHFRSQEYTPYAGGPLPYQFRDGGYPFRDLGVHSLYLLEAFLGAIEDATLQLGPPSRDGCPLFKEWRTLLRCSRGMGQIYYSWNVLPPQDVLLIHGTRGVIRADLMGMSVTTRRKGWLPGAAQRVLNTLNEGRGMMTQVTANVFRVITKRLRRYHGLQVLVREFYESLQAGSPPPVTVDDARPIVDWTERIARQADQEKENYVARFPTRGTAKVLLTGATGFIGRHLLPRLLADKDRVRILVRHSPSDEVLRDDRVEVFLGNLGNPADVDRAMEGISEVYHLGATIEGWAEDFQCASVTGTENMVQSAIRHGVQKFVYMSSLSVLHMAAESDGRKIAENWPLEPFPERRGLYSQTKLAAERVVTEAVKNRGLRAIILRPGEVMGPDRALLSGAVGIETNGRVLVLGNGRFTVPLVWMEDLIDAVMAAAASDRFDGSTFHIVDPADVTQDEQAEYYLRMTGRRKKITHLPLTLLYPAAACLRLALGMLGRSAPITPYRLRSAIGRRQFDCSAAATVLGWQPRVGIREAMSPTDTGPDRGML